MGSRKLHICPKVTKMGSLIGQRIDYNGVGALRGQRHIPSKNYPSTLSPKFSTTYPIRSPDGSALPAGCEIFLLHGLIAAVIELDAGLEFVRGFIADKVDCCLLYTSPSPRD